MILALAIYLSGGRHLPGKAACDETGQELPKLSGDERRRVAYLILIIALTVFPCIRLSDDLEHRNPVHRRSRQSCDSLRRGPGFVVQLDRRFRKHRRGSTAGCLMGLAGSSRAASRATLERSAIGCALTGASALFIVVGCMLAGPDGKVGVIWPILCFIGMGFAFIWYWPVVLALISLAAPQKVNSTLMGASFLALFVGSVIMGWVGSFYDG